MKLDEQAYLGGYNNGRRLSHSPKTIDDNFAKVDEFTGILSYDEELLHRGYSYIIGFSDGWHGMKAAY